MSSVSRMLLLLCSRDCMSRHTALTFSLLCGGHGDRPPLLPVPREPVHLRPPGRLVLESRPSGSQPDPVRPSRPPPGLAGPQPIPAQHRQEVLSPGPVWGRPGTGPQPQAPACPASTSSLGRTSGQMLTFPASVFVHAGEAPGTCPHPARHPRALPGVQARGPHTSHLHSQLPQDTHWPLSVQRGPAAGD